MFSVWVSFCLFDCWCCLFSLRLVAFGCFIVWFYCLDVVFVVWLFRYLLLVGLVVVFVLCFGYDDWLGVGLIVLVYLSFAILVFILVIYSLLWFVCAWVVGVFGCCAVYLRLTVIVWFVYLAFALGAWGLV